jgi:hypothetical protein
MATEQQAQLVTEITNQTRETETPPAWVSSTSEWVQESVIADATQASIWQQTLSDKKDPSTSSGWPVNKWQPTSDNQQPVWQPATDNGQPIKDDGVMTKSERDDIRADLKKSFKDLWRIPYLLILPLLNLIQSQYEKIPEERRKWLSRMSKDIKTSGKDGIQKLKDRWNKKDDKKEETKEEVKAEITTTWTTQTPLWQTTTDNGQTNPSPAPISTTINVETDTGKQIKVTTTIESESKKNTPN